MDEPIEMMFGTNLHGPKQPDPSTKKGNFGGRPAHWKALGVSAAVYAAKRVIWWSIMACSERVHSILN